MIRLERRISIHISTLTQKYKQYDKAIKSNLYIKPHETGVNQKKTSLWYIAIHKTTY